MSGRVLIAGTHSGCGKTTVVCAILAALKARNLKLSGFKCGPDFIDPMFHREAVGIPSHNLDPFFLTEQQLRGALASQTGLSVTEGVMGFYDGVGPEGRFSTFNVAAATETPAVLVIDAAGMYASAGAVLRGFCSYRRDSHIRGVIFNNTTATVYKGLSEIAEREGVIPLGFLPRRSELSVKSRHLGLITAAEIADIEERLRVLGRLAEEYIDLNALLKLAATAKPLAAEESGKPKPPRVRIAVARDKAFCFIYQENLELLRRLGCEIVFFSPLNDTALPEQIGGLYLPGGYPELHLEELSKNTEMLRAVSCAVESGMPTIAECGGFLYLHATLDGYQMAGVIRARAYRTERLRRFGYVTLRARRDNLLCRAGEEIRSHEFHYYDSTDGGDGFVAHRAAGTEEWACVHASKTLYAGFPHLYFPANAGFAESFVNSACRYSASGAFELAREDGR